MSTPDDSRREPPSTYIVQDRSEDTLIRLHNQDQMLNAGMGGVLPEQADPTIFHRVLDVACGTGGWLIAAAKSYPTMSLLVGVDLGSRMLAYAQAQAEAQQVSDRVQFRTMDALGVLDFPDNSFDLVNQRFGESFVRTWEWRALLGECQRVTRPGGAVRITECDFAQSNSPAMTRLFDPFIQALYNAGRLFTPSQRGILDELASLLERNGLENVQTRTHLLEYRPGGPHWEAYSQNMRFIFRSLLPFLRKWTRVPADYEALYQQALLEMQEPGFVAKWTLLTAWGISPSKKR